VVNSTIKREVKVEIEKKKSRVSKRPTLLSNKEIAARLEKAAAEKELATLQNEALSLDKTWEIEETIQSGVGIANIRLLQVRTEIADLEATAKWLAAKIEKSKTEFAGLAATLRMEKPLVPSILRNAGYPKGQRQQDKIDAAKKKTSSKSSTSTSSSAPLMSAAEIQHFKSLMLSGDFAAAEKLIHKN
jgi:hypothetical protein